MPACHRCGTAFDAPGIVSRGATCASCNASLKSCRNCELHDDRAKNGCREPTAEPVADKAAANFCEYYVANRKSGAAPESPKTPPEDPFAALFKK